MHLLIHNERIVKEVQIITQEQGMENFLLSVDYSPGGKRAPVMASHMERQSTWILAVSSAWKGRIGNPTLYSLTKS